jgi:hypothetical protein
MTEADELAQRRAIQRRYDQLLEEATRRGFSGESQSNFMFEGMRRCRTEWLENFLANRNY